MQQVYACGRAMQARQMGSDPQKRELREAKSGARVRSLSISTLERIEGCAGVVKLVDALDSKSSSERSVGSIPTARTKFLRKYDWDSPPLPYK